MLQRKLALRNHILMIETFKITNSILQSKSQKNKDLSALVLRLSDEKKDFITDCLINMAKYDFRVQFLKWFLDTKLNPEETERIKELQEGI